jgi:penicillin-binding protein 2
MPSEKEILESTQRLRKVTVVVFCGLLVLALALFHVQIVRGAFYDARLRQQSLRSVKLPAVRGRIFDRNRVCLADNRPSYGVAMYFQELRREASKTKRLTRLQLALNTAGTLSRTLSLPAVNETALRAHLSNRPSVPMVLWSDLGPDRIAVFSEQISTQPGVDIAVMTTREYPLGARTAHVLGHLGRKLDTEDEREGYYLQPDLEGKTGIEAALDASLHGTPGGRIVQLDVSGYSENTFSEIPAESGADAVLTLDARLQQIAESALASAPMPKGNPLRGAAVVVDVTNGDVLAAVSLPSFDTNLFSRGITRERYNELLNDPGKPFLNRALHGQYPPGSVFKPFVMLAGLESAAITPQTTSDCGGSMRFGGQVMRCWETRGHGRVGIVEAMKVSCDVFFYQQGIKMGVRPIKQWAEIFGFGASSGGLLWSAKGFIPDDTWLLAKSKGREKWTDGRTANVAIGQGEVLVTPLQMALATAAIANGGVLWQPRFVQRLEAHGDAAQTFEPQVKRKVSVSREHFELVRRMMLEVVESPSGTGGRARVTGVRVAGKTGTAEVGPPHARKNIAWFVAFAPFDHPRYAVAVVVENGDHGGTTAAPVAARIFAGLFDRQYSETGGETRGD